MHNDVQVSNAMYFIGEALDNLSSYYRHDLEMELERQEALKRGYKELAIFYKKQEDIFKVHNMERLIIKTNILIGILKSLKGSCKV